MTKPRATTKPPARKRRSPELAAHICRLVAEGSRLTDVAKLPRMPTWRAMTRWLKDDKGFRQRYDAARATRASMLRSAVMETIPPEWRREGEEAGVLNAASGNLESPRPRACAREEPERPRFLSYEIPETERQPGADLEEIAQ